MTARHDGRLVTPAFLFVAVATLAYFIADGITLPITPRYADGPLGAEPLGVGIAVGAFSVSAIALRPWVGRIADRRGRRLLMIAGAGLFAVGMLGHLLAVNMTLLIVMRLIIGAGEACFFVGAMTAISDMAPEGRRGEAISFFSLSLYLGVGIGPILGEAALGSEERYTLVWVLAAGMAATAAVLGLRVTETRVAEPEPVPGEPASRSRLIHPAALLPGVVLLLGGAAMSGFLAFLPLYALELGDDGARAYLAVFAGVVVVSRLVGAKLPDRLGARRLTTGSMALAGVGLAGIFVGGSSAALLAGTAVFALGVAFTFPALSALVVNAVPASQRGAAVGTFSAFLDIAFGAGPVAMGTVAAVGGYGAAFGAGAVLSVAGAIVLLAGTRGR